MEFVSVDKSKFEEKFNKKVEDSLAIYGLKDETLVGFGFINKDEKNTISVLVLEKYRGNGYGTMLFRNLLEVVKKRDEFRELEFVVKTNDIPVNRIIRGNGGVLVFQNSDNSKYIIPLK